MNFSLKLKELRENKGISQRELATTLQVGVGSVGMWESTDRMPNAKQLVSIAKYFEVTTDYLLGLEDDFGAKVAAPMGDTYTAEERQLIEDFRQLNYYKRDLIKNSIKAMLPTEAESKQKKKGIKNG